MTNLLLSACEEILKLIEAALIGCLLMMGRGFEILAGVTLRPIKECSHEGVFLRSELGMTPKLFGKNI